MLLKMLTYVSFVLLLNVYSINGFELRKINEKLGYIEDRINAENKFRRDDFNMLFTEINSLKEMMQHSLQTKAEEKDTKLTDHVREDITKELEGKILQLTIGFKEEKKTNIRLRRKTHELYRQVADLKTIADKTTDVLEKILQGVETLAKQKDEREHRFNQFSGDVSEIKINVQNLTDNLELTKNEEEQNFDTLHTYTKNIKENIEQLKEKQKLCLKKANISREETTTMEEKQEKISSDERNICSCSNASVLEQSTPSIEQSIPLYKSCNELYKNGNKTNGIYQIDIGEEEPLSVYCDMDTDNGGWTVFQRRQNGSVDFFRDWNAYKNGFGDLNGEFWLGNNYLNILTDDDQQHELRIDLEDFEGNCAFAKYSNFKVQQENMKYRLEVSGYSGNAGDSLNETELGDWSEHNMMKFTTKDDDNDNSSENCASNYLGGWWFNHCFASHLNGLYLQKADCKNKWHCIIWNSWKGPKTSMMFTEMKVR